MGSSGVKLPLVEQEADAPATNAMKHLLPWSLESCVPVEDDTGLDASRGFFRHYHLQTLRGPEHMCWTKYQLSLHHTLLATLPHSTCRTSHCMSSVQGGHSEKKAVRFDAYASASGCE